MDKIIKVRKYLIAYHKANYNKTMDINSQISCNNNISDRQCDIMYIIKESDNNTLSQISKELNLSLSSLSIIISKMVDNNLIVKSYGENEADDRLIFLRLTGEGEYFYCEIKKIATNAIENFIKSLDDKSYKIYFKVVSDLRFICEFLGDKYIDEFMTPYEQSLIIYHNLVQMKFVGEKLFKSINYSYDKFIYEKGLKLLASIIEDNLHTPSKIARKFRSSESTISTQLNSLVKKNLLYKEKKPGDGRKTYFYATEEGQIVLNKCLEDIENTISTVVEGIDEEFKVKLDSGLDNLILLFELILKNINVTKESTQ